MHIKEEDCVVKKAVLNGEIAEFLYNNYLSLVKSAHSDIEGYKRR